MYKFAAIMNKKIEAGKIMNALAHISLSIAAQASDEQKKAMGFIDYIDKDGNNHRSISQLSYVILRADNANQIRTVRNAARTQNILFADFTNTMTEDTYVEQLKRTQETPEAELDYFGICLFGTKEEVEALTKKFSLWR